MSKRIAGILLMVLGIAVLIVGVTGGVLPFRFQLTGDFIDDFDDGIIGSEWAQFSSGNPDPLDQEILEQGGNLICRTPTGRSWCGLISVGRYDFTEGGSASVQVVRQDQTASAVLALGPNIDSNQYSVRIIRYLPDGAVIAKQWGDGPATGVELGRRNGLATTLKIEISGGSVSFYADGVQFAGTTISSTDLYAFIWGSTSVGWVGDVNFDNFMLSAGAGPGPGTGTLRVECWVDGSLTNPSGGYVTITPTVGTVQTTLGVWQGTVSSGSYSVTATYDGQAKSASGTVSDGGSVTLKLEWGTGGPSDWWEILQDPMVKALLSMVGMGMFCIGFVFTLQPKRQKFSYGFKF